MSALLFGIMLSGDQEFPVLMISISGFIIISLIGLSMIYIVFLTAKMIFLHKKSEDKPVHYYPEDSRTGKPIGQAVPGDTSKADPKKKKSITKKKSMSKKKKKSLAKKKAKKKEKQKRKSKKKKGKKTSDSSDDGSSDEEDSEGSEDVSISGDINTLNSPDGLELQSLDLNELENMDDAALAALLADGDGADLDEDALTALLEQAEEEPETKEEKLGDAVLNMKAASAFSILGLAGAVDPAPSDSDADSDVHVTM
jgi:hypothetical protein